MILIVRAKNVAIGLSEIKEIVALYDRKDGCETQNRVAIDKFRRRIESLESQRNEIELQIETLKESCANLESQLAGQIAEGKLAKSVTETRKRAKPAPVKVAVSNGAASASV